MNYGFWNFVGDHPGVDIALFICLYYIVAELTNIRVSITHRNKTDRKSGLMDMFPPISPLRPTRLPEPPEEKGVKKGGA